MPISKEAITDLANDLRPIVQDIQNKPKTTQGWYGDYLSLIPALAEGRDMAIIVCYALVEAGANPQGVQSAFKILHGDI